MAFNSYKLLINVVFYDRIGIPLGDTASTPISFRDFCFDYQEPKQLQGSQICKKGPPNADRIIPSPFQRAATAPSQAQRLSVYCPSWHTRSRQQHPQVALWSPKCDLLFFCLEKAFSYFTTFSSVRMGQGT